ncbi:MAG: S1C family serine protease [Deltaproteobacteria bacterium]|nr:S1C family serine protease [Deltaproteobacteria bacterium]
MKRTATLFAAMLLAAMFCHPGTLAAKDDELAAVVRIRALFPEDAESTAKYGRERAGTGVVIDAEGTILTLSFLTRDAEHIEVTGPDNAPATATLIGHDFGSGLSLLKPSRPLGVAPITMGKSAAVGVGDIVIVASAGNEGGVQMTRVVSRKEFAGTWEYYLDNAIFTTPAFADFSGAALLNRQGQLIGIGYLLTPVALAGFGLLPCNLFIPIDTLGPVLTDLKSAGRPLQVRKPWLGINADEAHGRVFITRVTAGGPAEKAGLKVEDMIISVGGQQVQGLADFYRKIYGLGEPGVPVPMKVLKGDQIQEIEVNSADRYKEQPQRNAGGIRI